MESSRETEEIDIIYYELGSHSENFYVSVLSFYRNSYIGFDILLESISVSNFYNLKEEDINNLFVRIIERGKYKESKVLLNKEEIEHFFDTRSLHFDSDMLKNKLRLIKLKKILE